MSELDTSASTVVSLHPAWRRPLEWLPVLSAYINGADPLGDTCLALDAREPDLPAEAVQIIVGDACEKLSGGRPFAEILLVEDPVDLASAAEPVRSAAELVERLGLPPAPRPAGPADVVAYARHAKQLADRYQGAADKALFEITPQVPTEGSPLVTVRIATYGDADLLVERAIPSALNGTHGEVEVLVCSDGPQPHAREAVAKVEDSRVRYMELPERSVYPQRPYAFWQTAGSYPFNLMLGEAKGRFIAPLDHDDAFTTDHIQVLLGALGSASADFAFGVGVCEFNNGTWGMIGSAPLRYANIIHASVLYSRRLLHMRYDPHSWLLGEPTDWNMWRRIAETGAGVAHIPVPVVVHFKEGTSMEGRDPGDPDRQAELEAGDVLNTSARELLEIRLPPGGVSLG